jgi:hypothetical protein
MIGKFDEYEKLLADLISRQFVRNSIYIRRSDPGERKALLAAGWEEILGDLSGWVFRKDLVEAGGPIRVN